MLARRKLVYQKGFRWVSLKQSPVPDVVMFTPTSESAEPVRDVLTLSRQLQIASVAKFPMIYLVAGARPNFMKIAPLVRALQADGRLRWKIVHTGQHYDHDMNEVFFEELGIPAPDVQLSAGRGTHAEQTSRIILAFEKLCIRDRPDCVLVVGDVNSTLACSIVAKKLNIRVAHVEAGLRSGDMSMPEEINRLVTDSISDWFFVTEPSGAAHLSREGKPADRVHEVGHVMVDNLLYQAAKLEQMDREALETSALKRRHPRYGVVTLHRPSNVDDPVVFKRLVSALEQSLADAPLVVPNPSSNSEQYRALRDSGRRSSRIDEAAGRTWPS